MGKSINPPSSQMVTILIFLTNSNMPFTDFKDENNQLQLPMLPPTTTHHQNHRGAGGWNTNSFNSAKQQPPLEFGSGAGGNPFNPSMGGGGGLRPTSGSAGSNSSGRHSPINGKNEYYVCIQNSRNFVRIWYVFMERKWD